MSARTASALVVLLGVAVWIGWLWGSSSAGAPGAALPVAEDEAAPPPAPPMLESDLGRRMRDETIGDLRSEVARLEAALRESRGETESLRKAAGTPGPDDAPPEGSLPKLPEATTGQALLEKMRSFSRHQLAALKDISLRGATLTRADVDLLASLPNLKSLSLRSTNITDADLEALAGLALDHLDLRATQVTGNGLPHLYTGLLSLHLTDTKVAPRDLDRLPHMERLETLKLNGIPVDDTGIGQIARFRGLRHLEIDRTLITHDGLARLLELNPEIRRIEARRSAVDGRKVGDLIAAHPNLDLVLQQLPMAHLPR